MSDMLKKAGLSVLGCIGIVFVSMTVLFFMLQSEWGTTRIENFASERFGRDIRVDNLDLQFSSTLSIGLRGVRVPNAAWGRANPLLAFEELMLDIDIWELLQGNLVFDRLVARDFVVNLEKNNQDQANWSIQNRSGPDNARNSRAKNERSNSLRLPIIRALKLAGGYLSFFDPNKEIDLKAAVDANADTSTGDGVITFIGDGLLYGESADLRLTIGAPLDLADDALQSSAINGETLLPIEANINLVGATVSLSGAVDQPLSPSTGRLDLRIRGQSLQRLSSLLDVALPPISNYRLDFPISLVNNEITIDGFSAILDDSDLSGDVLA